MTPTIREAQASGYPRDKMYAIWWAGSEGDVKDLGEGPAITIHNSGADHDKVYDDLKKHVYDRARAPTSPTPRWAPSPTRAA